MAHHHSPGIIKTNNFKVLYDADLLAKMEEEMTEKEMSKFRGFIAESFLTPTSRALAEKTYIIC
jgi:hypothetical protein